jgi:Ni,Fe-hydrogenase III large subunit
VTAIEHVRPESWRETVSGALAGGARFAGGWASAGAWRVALAAPAHTRVLSCDASSGHVPAIVDLAEAAAWDEREAHDLHGLRFDGHAPLRALADHPDDPGAWTTPVSGAGVHQVAVGPIHAGVIESGHFRFHVNGERILAVDPRLFYKHRGLERAAEGRGAGDALAYAQRACAACAVANSASYAMAVEDARGLAPDRELRIARTVALELARLYNPLNDISAICAGVGFAPGTMAFAAHKDRAQQINAAVSGHRFLFGSVAVARGALALDAATADTARAALRELRADSAAAWRDLQFAGPVQARLDGVGVLAHDDALRLGAVGPAARAAGVRDDVRSRHPRLWYPDFTAASPAAPSGDVGARLQLRAAELEATYDILDELLAGPVAAGTAAPARDPGALGIGRVESPRGATTCVVELKANTIARLHLRTGSYANWPALAHASADALLPDFPLINKSFELCYACVDR